MNKIIIIKYGELSTKGDNINFFLKKLKTNIEKSLKDINYDLKYDRGRMFIETNDYDKVLDILKHTFGIHEINVGYKLDTNDFNLLEQSILDKLKEKSFNTFKVETKRSDKSYFLDSMEVSKKIGGTILKNIDNINVDVRNPEILVNVEIRKEETLFYFEKIKGLGGYPVGTQGKGLLMLSGGIDSPVAGYLAIKRGISLDVLYFDSPPHTSLDAKNKVIRLAKSLKKYDINLGMYVANFTKLQETIYKTIPHEYLITVMRRMMYRITEKTLYKNKGLVIVNGESIGQVASQTLTSMNAINEVAKRPVIRPVACLDKLEIIDIAKKIDTYNISIEPYDDCCTVFVPKHPVINPDLDKCYEYESMFEYEPLIDEIINNLEYIKLEDIQKFSDLL